MSQSNCQLSLSDACFGIFLSLTVSMTQSFREGSRIQRCTGRGGDARESSVQFVRSVLCLPYWSVDVASLQLHKMLRLTLNYTVHTEGFAVIDEFLLPEECDELTYAMGEFTTMGIPDAHKHVFSATDPDHKHASDKYFLESNDKIRPFFEKDALDEQGNLIVPPSHSLNKVGHALHLLHPLFRCYTYSDRVKKTCVDLGFTVPAVAQSMAIYKNPGIGGEVSTHQDATFLYTEPKPAIGFWIALEDATIENGCLWIARGSHKSGVHRRMIRNPDASSEDVMIYDRPAPTYPDSIFTPVPVSKGSCILLHGHVVHKSAINRSPNARPAYTFHVIEKHMNNYSSSNWLQEGAGAPFHNLYRTLQLM